MPDRKRHVDPVHAWEAATEGPRVDAPRADPAHWKCPDCGAPCSCSPESLARRMVHRACGFAIADPDSVRGER